jgi:hypothetical protein
MIFISILSLLNQKMMRFLPSSCSCCLLASLLLFIGNAQVQADTIVVGGEGGVAWSEGEFAY